MLHLLLGLASAQDAQTVDIDRFKPPADAYGYLATEGAESLGHLQLGVGLWANYANDPVVLVDQNGDRVGVLADGTGGPVEQRMVANAHLGLGVTEFISLTGDLPVILWQQGYEITGLTQLDSPAPITASGLGDLRVTPKVTPVSRDEFPVGLALSVPVGVPTGGDTSFMSEDAVTVQPTLVLEASDASVWRRQYKWRAALNLGYLVRPADRARDVQTGSALVYRAALGYRVADPAEIMLDVYGQSWGAQKNQAPLEAALGAKILIGPWMTANVGAGFGLVPGLGTPDYRAIVGLTAAPSFDPNARDSDNDGVPDGVDRCPKHAEDLDGFRDDDGCPDTDNDGDGIEDEIDRCPMDPEDDDGFMDNDGCPEADNDNDGVPDLNDRCPNQAEDMNGYKDDDGCPDVADSDGDGFNDDVDRCPYDPEDMDGVEDNDGCPDEDRVVVKEGRIQINEKIYFETGKAVIKTDSYDLLDEIARVIQKNPQLLLIRVEGHTDSDGSDVANLKLSTNRAAAVKAYLVDKGGVEASRLTSVGLGESSPIDTNDTDAGKANNRRVEFIIMKESE